MRAYIEPLLAIKIYEFYPKRIVIIPIEDDETDRWSAAIYEVIQDPKDPELMALGDTLYDLGHYENRSSLGAIEEMNFVLKRAMEVVTVMSN